MGELCHAGPRAGCDGTDLNPNAGKAEAWRSCQPELQMRLGLKIRAVEVARWLRALAALTEGPGLNSQHPYQVAHNSL